MGTETMLLGSLLPLQLLSQSKASVNIFPLPNSGEELPASAGDIRDVGSSTGLGRSPGEGNGNPLQYSCLENPMDRGAWWAIAHRVAKIQTQLKQHTHT